MKAVSMAKPLHVVIWGATGFTGKLVAEHIARDYKGGEVRWALAGRNREKLEGVRAELAAQYGEEIKEIPILLGSLDDPSSLDAIASKTSVILSTAGPYAKIGTPVVEAAVRNRTHYCDLTAEIPWIRSMIDAHHEEAASHGTRIVHCCGYDSVPSDLGAWFVVNEMQRRMGKTPTRIVSAVLDAKGGISGGTIASGMGIVSELSKADGTDKKDIGTPYALVPKGLPLGTSTDRWLKVDWSDALKTYLAAFVMQLCNSRVVQRSNYLLGWGGPEFDYEEALGVPYWVGAKLVALGTLASVLAFSRLWMHPLLRRVLPAPGEGPSRDAMLNGHWTHRIVGTSNDGDMLIVEVGDKSRDPGYWGTSRMLLESGLVLALQEDELNKHPGVLKGGVLTPASAMGQALVDRLRAAGIHFEVKEERRAKQAPKDSSNPAKETSLAS